MRGTLTVVGLVLAAVGLLGGSFSAEFLLSHGLLDFMVPYTAPPATRAQIERVHDAAYVDALIAAAPRAQADTVAYLVNVTVRPGYNFPNADAAIGYGYRICDKIAQGRRYADLITDIESDFNTTDEYQASYLIAQAANELCPALVWQLRNSAANYRPRSP